MEYEEFCREQLAGLVRFAAALTGDTELAQDLVQDALIRAYPRWPKVSRLDRPDLYLRKMVVNGHLSWLRRWYQRSVRSSHDLIEAAHPVAADPAARIADAGHLAELLSGLSRRQQAAIVLRYFEDRDDAEIAQVLGCGQATVRSHVSRGLSALRIRAKAERAEASS
ncbi:SigE family RNA polymerase sigma factor [Solihabitans fulvus]|uniref:SigE family RNA polymerase sigma factor n=1 Tax=Solihabitans fulvus TaxID=1892852 RepID=A0A5B2XL42_9PSEU|nr:SigE family RNA polymerase sigma factor [Solihabitans fulvus]KAA2263824.1 SigE family RNA polymerase sigma factor [Solihabitans fulvus]